MIAKNAGNNLQVYRPFNLRHSRHLSCPTKTPLFTYIYNYSDYKTTNNQIQGTMSHY